MKGLSGVYKISLGKPFFIKQLNDTIKLYKNVYE